jgi:hypothetical protein
VGRLCRVGPGEQDLPTLAARSARRRQRELRQLQLDRAAHCAAMAGLALVSWQWPLLSYLSGVPL